MIHSGQINADNPVVLGAFVVIGCLVLYVAFKIGFVILKILLGLVGLALLGGALWWFFSGMHS
ncbi:MAG TPA: hypothetical protein VL527_16030 [Dongiaceae bacterium]|jgi:hypothetical protein|nr:hypothetical protein [Dongiaceae bacterium]